MNRSEEGQARLGELLRRARKGEKSALGRLLETHVPYLRLLSERYLTGGLGARVGSSDIVQETCLSVHKRIRDFDSDDPEKFLAWLREIHLQNVKNVLRDHLRTGKRALTREDAMAATLIVEDPSPQVQPSQRLLLTERSVQLAQALEQLSEPQREAIRLRFLEGLLLREVAARMQCAEPSVVGLIHRGLLRLKDVLPNHSPEAQP